MASQPGGSGVLITKTKMFNFSKTKTIMILNTKISLLGGRSARLAVRLDWLLERNDLTVVCSVLRWTCCLCCAYQLAHVVLVAPEYCRTLRTVIFLVVVKRGVYGNWTREHYRQ